MLWWIQDSRRGGQPSEEGLLKFPQNCIKSSTKIDHSGELNPQDNFTGFHYLLQGTWDT